MSSCPVLPSDYQKVLEDLHRHSTGASINVLTYSSELWKSLNVFPLEALLHQRRHQKSEEAACSELSRCLKNDLPWLGKC